MAVNILLENYTGLGFHQEASTKEVSIKFLCHVELNVKSFISYGKGNKCYSGDYIIENSVVYSLLEIVLSIVRRETLEAP